jgi:hypothetical protein
MERDAGVGGQAQVRGVLALGGSRGAAGVVDLDVVELLSLLVVLDVDVAAALDLEASVGQVGALD